MNLISNAFKFTHRGGIYVKIKLENRVAFDNERYKYLVFEVTDTGVGMAPSEIKNLFTMFSTIDRHRNSLNIRGTGLGLTISKKLTEMLGGKISVKSEEGKGTTFTFDVKEGIQRESGAEDAKINIEVQNSINIIDDFSDINFSQITDRI